MWKPSMQLNIGLCTPENENLIMKDKTDNSYCHKLLMAGVWDTCTEWLQSPVKLVYVVHILYCNLMVFMYYLIR